MDRFELTKLTALQATMMWQPGARLSSSPPQVEIQFGSLELLRDQLEQSLKEIAAAIHERDERHRNEEIDNADAD
jgi:hypothetical protein